jgi:hypothetical protein
MASPALSDLEQRCQKPDHRRIGNWMARRLTRPLALRVTRVVLPWGVSAHMATLAAWAVALAAVVCLGCGTIAGWVTGAILLQLWYLLDHVDGQLARYLGTESLDGAALDYLMHHTVNLLVPISIGWGMSAGGQRGWLLLGIAWGVGLLLLGLVNDVRYKAFLKRLKRLEGELRVIGGGGGRPAPPPAVPRRPLAAAVWLARKTCETHVMMNVASLLALVQLLLGDSNLVVGQVYLATMGLVAPLLATATIGRSLHRESAEREFAAWFQPPPGCDLVYDSGWWRVEEAEGVRG